MDPISKSCHFYRLTSSWIMVILFLTFTFVACKKNEITRAKCIFRAYSVPLFLPLFFIFQEPGQRVDSIWTSNLDWGLHSDGKQCRWCRPAVLITCLTLSQLTTATVQHIYYYNCSAAFVTYVLFGSKLANLYFLNGASCCYSLFLFGRRRSNYWNPLNRGISKQKK